VRNAKLGRSETLSAMKRLDERARAMENIVKGPAFVDIIATERALSATYGGRTV
jgi:hypothetical protein